MSDCKSKYIDEDWFVMVRKGYLTLLTHHCDLGDKADVACWDRRKECWYCDRCGTDAPPLVEFVALLYPATQMRIGRRI